jgi:hypothetical protein
MLTCMERFDAGPPSVYPRPIVFGTVIHLADTRRTNAYLEGFAAFPPTVYPSPIVFRTGILLADTNRTNAYLEGFDAVSTGLLFQDARGSTLRNMLETADSYTIFQCLL